MVAATLRNLQRHGLAHYFAAAMVNHTPVITSYNALRTTAQTYTLSQKNAYIFAANAAPSEGRSLNSRGSLDPRILVWKASQSERLTRVTHWRIKPKIPLLLWGVPLIVSQKRAAMYAPQPCILAGLPHMPFQILAVTCTQCL